MTDDLMGVNDAKIDVLVQEINDIATNIYDKLNKIEETMENVKYCFKCEQADEFLSKFHKISSDFPIVRDNLLAISPDSSNVSSWSSSMNIIALSLSFIF